MAIPPVLPNGSQRSRGTREGKFVGPLSKMLGAVRDGPLERAGSGDAATRQRALEHGAIQQSLGRSTVTRGIKQ